MSGRTIVVVGGYWSTNIGNSFFQLGAQYLLAQAFPSDRIVMLSDQPGYWDVRRGNPPTALDYLAAVQTDYLVILGPYLRPEYPRLWAETLRQVIRRGTKIVVLGAGMMEYSASMFESARRWLSRIPPFVFITRDSETYRNLGDLAEHSYDGVDVATFVSDIHQPVSTSLPRYVVFNFDKVPEPRVTIASTPVRDADVDCVLLDGMTWCFHFPRIQTLLSHRFKAFPFVRALLPRLHNAPECIGGKMVVRTDHRFNPMLLRKSYAYPNSFVSDIPQTYLNLYANSDATFSNRVHACVAALAYGRPARLFSPNERALLLDRLGVANTRRYLCTIDLNRLRSEKLAMIDFLRTAVA